MAYVDPYDFLNGQMAADANAGFPEQRQRKQFMSGLMGGDQEDYGSFPEMLPSMLDLPDGGRHAEPDAEPDADSDDVEFYGDIDPNTQGRILEVVGGSTDVSPGQKADVMQLLGMAGGENMKERGGLPADYRNPGETEKEAFERRQELERIKKPADMSKAGGMVGQVMQGAAPAAPAETPEQRGRRLADEEFQKRGLSPAAGRLDLPSAIAAAHRKVQTHEPMSQIEAEMAAQNAQRSRLSVQDMIARSRYDQRASDALWNAVGQDKDAYLNAQDTGKMPGQLRMEAEQNKAINQQVMIEIEAQRANIANQLENRKLDIEKMYRSGQIDVEKAKADNAKAEMQARLQEAALARTMAERKMALAEQTAREDMAKWQGEQKLKEKALGNQFELGKLGLGQKAAPKPVSPMDVANLAQKLMKDAAENSKPISSQEATRQAQKMLGQAGSLGTTPPAQGGEEKPVAKDRAGKPVYKRDGKYVYADGTQYKG